MWLDSAKITQEAVAEEDTRAAILLRFTEIAMSFAWVVTLGSP